MPTHNVLIIGGGWAGLTAAIYLVDHGLPVTLIEAAPQLGGRARTINFSDKKVDNGQHLMVGAYTRVRALMSKLGVNKEALLHIPLHIKVRSSDKHFSFQLPNIRWPFNILFGILWADSFTLSERWALFKFCRKLEQTGFKIQTEMSVADFLYTHSLSERLIQHLFEPLCLSALSTPASYASTQVFLNVLQNTFSGHQAHSELLFATQDLSELLPLPAKQYIEKRGGTVITHARAENLIIEQGRIGGVHTSRGWMHSEQVILATSFHNALPLLKPHVILDPLSAQLAQLEHEHITTIYLQYPAEIALSLPMVGLSHTWSQWVFDRRFAKQPGLMAVVITGEGPHSTVNNKTLITHIVKELHTHFPTFPIQPKAARVIREKRAAFSCRVGINKVRPAHQTPLPGLWLAGDYTCTGYPATLEGAVKSGQLCAEQLLKVQNERVNEYL